MYTYLTSQPCLRICNLKLDSDLNIALSFSLSLHISFSLLCYLDDVQRGLFFVRKQVSFGKSPRPPHYGQSAY